MIDGKIILALFAIIVVCWLVFYVLQIPLIVKQAFGILLAIGLLLWALMLMGVVNF